MKWQSESWAAERARLEDWHGWFAWHPVRIGEQIVWLEHIERIGELAYEGGWLWTYREAP